MGSEGMIGNELIKAEVRHAWFVFLTVFIFKIYMWDNEFILFDLTEHDTFAVMVLQ